MKRKSKISHKLIIKYNNVAGRGEILACLRKKKRSRAEAKAYAYKHNMWFYKCDYCGKYHVTSKPHYDNDNDLYERIAKILIDGLMKG